MFIYWLLFIFPVFVLRPSSPQSVHSSKLAWRTFAFILIALIGLRSSVGGDWFTYLDNLDELRGIPLEELFDTRRDPAYQLLSWLSLSLGLDIYGINLFCALLFTIGLIKLSRAQTYSWLAIVVAIPYLVVVVAMGYTRQATAIGLLMYGVVYLLRGRLLIYLLFVILAGLFHKSAFIFAAFALFMPGGGAWKRVLGVVLLVVLAGAAFLVEQAEILLNNYVAIPMESDGGAIRIFMNLPPALILLVYWKKWGAQFDDRWFWSLFALLAIVCVPLVFIASTAVDRMALYLIPIQIVVWSRFPLLVQGTMPRIYAVLMVIFYYAAVQLVWLLYGAHAMYWLPYDNLLFLSF